MLRHDSYIYILLQIRTINNNLFTNFIYLKELQALMAINKLIYHLEKLNRSKYAVVGGSASNKGSASRQIEVARLSSLEPCVVCTGPARSPTSWRLWSSL